MNRHLLPLVLLLVPGCSDTWKAPEPAEPLTCSDVTYRYFAIDGVQLAYDAEGEVDGFDLDHDDPDGYRPDNQGGRALDTMFETYAEQDAVGSWTAQLEDRLAGPMVWVVEIASCGSNGDAQVNLRQGVREAGAVRLVDTVPTDGEQPSRPATGSRAAGHVRAEDGIGVAPLGALADLLGGADPAWHAAVGVTTDLELGDTTVVGRVGFAFAPPYRTVVGEAFLGWLNARLDVGESDYAAYLDKNEDGIVTYEELTAEPIFDLLMREDVDLFDAETGVYFPGHDEISDSFAFCMDVHAVEVTVE